MGAAIAMPGPAMDIWDCLRALILKPDLLRAPKRRWCCAKSSQIRNMW